MGAMTTYHITIRDRETQTVLGYYNGSWTSDAAPSISGSARWRKRMPPVCASAVRATPTSSKSRY